MASADEEEKKSHHDPTGTCSKDMQAEEDASKSVAFQHNWSRPGASFGTLLAGIRNWQAEANRLLQRPQAQF